MWFMEIRIRVRVHHGEKMCDEALEHGDEDKVECWFKDSVVRFDVGRGMESDEDIIQ